MLSVENEVFEIGVLLYEAGSHSVCRGKDALLILIDKNIPLFAKDILCT